MNLKSLKLMLFILGTVIGAGFASGKEVATFFTRFGYFSIPLAIICGLLFYLTAKMFLESSSVIKPNNFSDISKHFFKKRSYYLDGFLLVCFLIVIGSMIAGSNSLGVLIFSNYNGIYIGIITAIVAGVFTIGGLKLMNKINLIIVPIMIVVMIVTCVLSFIYVKPSNDIIFTQVMINDYLLGLGSTIIYVCLNILLSGLILMQVGKDYSKKEIKSASRFLGATIASIIILISLSLILSNFSIFESDMPIIALAINISKSWSYVISIIVWFAILTSIVSTAYVVSNYLKKFIKNNVLSVFITVFVSILVSNLGFSVIVKYLYPLMGVIGLFLIILIFKETSKINIFSKNKKLKLK